MTDANDRQYTPPILSESDDNEAMPAQQPLMIDNDSIEPSEAIISYYQSSEQDNYDIMSVLNARNAYNSEPTIIDAIKAMTAYKLCCCLKLCNLDNIESVHFEDENDTDFEDEVQKAMMSKNKFGNKDKNEISKDLHAALMNKQKDRSFEARMRCYCIPCIRYKPMIWQIISVSICLQLLGFVIMGTVNAMNTNSNQSADKEFEFRIFAQFLLGIMWFFQLMLMIQLILIAVNKLWNLKFIEIIQLYLTSILIFCGIYSTAYFYDEHSQEAFNWNDTEFKNANYGSRIVAFFYFSCSQQTLCGVCEIIPTSPPTQILAACQMLIGVFFGIIIISIGISRFGEDLEERRQQIRRDIEAKHDVTIRRSMWQTLRDHDTVIALRRCARKYLLLIVSVIQISKNVTEWATNDIAAEHKILHSLLFVLFDVFNVFVVLMTSLKFIHIGHMTELRLNFLCQTYLSVMLIFTGVYADLQVSTGTSYEDGAFVTAESTFLGMWTKFVYFSFAMMTLCGAGLDIKPKTWYASLAICAQMLLGLFFHVYIFGIGLLLLANKKTKKMSQRNQNENNKENVVGSELIMSTLLN